MKCNCVITVETRVAEHVSKEIKTPAQAECQAVSFTLGATLDVALRIPFKVTADAVGYRKGKIIPVFVSFCPFCGKSAKPESAGSAADTGSGS